MPFDGVVMKCVAMELNKELVSGRIEKIYQPSGDEVILYIRSISGQKRLLLSANPSNPRIHFTASTGPNPEKPPMFCMLLRKYIGSGIIRTVFSHDYERILELHIESMNDMGDLVLRRLIIEIMGRRSNIMLINENGFIIDSIRHVDFEMSRVREVMPGREYVLPPAQDKVNPEQLDINKTMGSASGSRARIEKFLLDQIKGFSPLLCRLICQEAGLFDNPPAQNLSADEIKSLSASLARVASSLKDCRFQPYLMFAGSTVNTGIPGTGAGVSRCLSKAACSDKPALSEELSPPVGSTLSEELSPSVEPALSKELMLPGEPALEEEPVPAEPSEELVQSNESAPCEESVHTAASYASAMPVSSHALPVDYHCIEFSTGADVKYYGTINEVLDIFHSAKALSARLDQKKASILKKLNAALQRSERKAFLQQSDIEESKNKDELKLFGELITANIHSISETATSVRLQNYYDPELSYVDIPLDINLSPQKNAQRYFKKYAKAKSTFAHATENLQKTQDEIDYLESLIYQTENCESLQELAELNDELAAAGFITQSGNKNAKQSEPSLPLHFVSSDGIDIYIGRNNRQNDLLTFKHAFKEDTWLHAKNIPGSHVIIHGKGKPPDRTIAEAAELAAYHSKSRNSAKVPVDIAKVKDVRKPKGFKPGLVLYDNFRTVYVTPREETVIRLRV